MKDLFTKTSTTSIIAVLIMIMGFALLFCLSFLETKIDAAMKTQIIQGDWNLMAIAALYYFGTSKQRNNAGPAIANAEEVNVSNSNSPA